MKKDKTVLPQLSKSLMQEWLCLPFINVLCLFTISGTVGLEIGVGRMVVIMIVRQTVLIKIG